MNHLVSFYFGAGIQRISQIPPAIDINQQGTSAKNHFASPTAVTNSPTKPKKGPQKCSLCPPEKKAFKNEDALASHLSSGYHQQKGNLSNVPKVLSTAKPKPATGINKCPKCSPEKGGFKSAEALANHLSSDYHKQKGDSSKGKTVPAVIKPKVKVNSYKCPRCPAKKGFKTAGDLASHLSSDYHSRRDQQNHKNVAVAQAPLAKASKKKTEKCPKCPPEKKPFKNKDALASHLSSGYHERKGSVSKVASPTMAQIPQASEYYQRPTAITPPPSPKQNTPFNMLTATTEELIKHLANTLANSPRTTFPPSVLCGLLTTLPATQMIILSAERETAIYAYENLTALAPPGITTHSCVIGESLIKNGMSALDGIHIVSGTVGCVRDAIYSSYLDVRQVKMLVLNEEELLLTGIMAGFVADIVRKLKGAEVMRTSLKMPEISVLAVR